MEIHSDFDLDSLISFWRSLGCQDINLNSIGMFGPMFRGKRTRAADGSFSVLFDSPSGSPTGLRICECIPQGTKTKYNRQPLPKVLHIPCCNAFEG